MPTDSSQQTSSVAVFDTRHDRTGSGFAKFKAWAEKSGFGVRVSPLPKVRTGGHHVAHVRVIAGATAALGASIVEDPSLMHCSGSGAEGVRLCVVISGEGVHHVPAQGAAFSPAVGQLLVHDASTEYAIEVRRRTWRIAAQVPAAALRVTDDELAEVLAREVRWQEWQSSFLASFGKGLLSLQAVQHSIPRGNVDQLLAGAAEFIVRSSLDGDRELSAAALRRARARGYIALRLADPQVSPAAVAADQGITPRQLARCFAEEETTVSAEIKRIRLERAWRYLLTQRGREKISMADVARMHGFSSLSHFSRSFAETYDVPPSHLLKP